MNIFSMTKGFIYFKRIIYKGLKKQSNKFNLEETNMKKALTGIAVMALVFSVSSTTAFAAGGGRGRGRNFVDNDNDGVCDYHNASCQFIDNNGDGLCDNYGSNNCGNGAGYVDADGDGICDNITSGTLQNGSGFKRGRYGGQGRRSR